jgi:hypothetical protein
MTEPIPALALEGQPITIIASDPARMGVQIVGTIAHAGLSSTGDVFVWVKVARLPGGK